jgi:hypothetical protein
VKVCGPVKEHLKLSLSPEARKRIAAAQRKRWAVAKTAKKAETPVATKKAMT